MSLHPVAVVAGVVVVVVVVVVVLINYDFAADFGNDPVKRRVQLRSLARHTSQPVNVVELRDS